ASPYTIKLKVIRVVADVTVVDPLDDSTEPETNADAVKFDDDLLADLPVADDDVLPLLANFSSSAAFGAGGLTMVVDGMEAGQFDVPAAGISSYKINKNPYSAEFQHPGKGTVQVKTEKGSKRSYHGSFSSLARNSVFDA